MKIKSVFWQMALLSAWLVACQASTPSPQPSATSAEPALAVELPLASRSFALGTAGFIPRNYPDSTAQDWQDFLSRGAAAYGGIFGVHTSPSAKQNAEGIPEQVQLAFEQMQGVTPYVALAVNAEEGPFTTARGEELKRVAVAIAQKYQPAYLSLGVEINRFYLAQPETFDLYVQFARAAYDAVKAVSPNTQVMNNFQFEYLRGQASLAGEEVAPHWELLERFAGKLDLVSFTVYPFLEFPRVAAIPPNYLAEIRAHTDLPILITETGWPSEATASGVEGSPQAQSDYLLVLAQQADSLEVVAINWVLPHDAAFGVAGGIFDHISLLNNDGTPKPAFAYWQALQALPQR